MLVIRKAQMDALNAYVVESFENEVAAQLAARFPERSAQMGEAGVRELIQAGIRKSLSYGVQAQDDVARVIELMVEFGEEFDKRPDLAWPCEALRDRVLTGDAKVSLLMSRLAARRRREHQDGPAQPAGPPAKAASRKASV
jgi:hypothetical protein